MFGYFSPEMAYGLLIACVVICFFVGHAMDGVMGPVGFGVFGNMIILGTGMAFGLFMAQYSGMTLTKTEVLVGVALFGSFGSLFTMTVLKHIFLRT
jgi:hypothetical protein